MFSSPAIYRIPRSVNQEVSNSKGFPAALTQGVTIPTLEASAYMLVVEVRTNIPLAIPTI